MMSSTYSKIFVESESDTHTQLGQVSKELC